MKYQESIDNFKYYLLVVAGGALFGAGICLAGYFSTKDISKESKRDNSPTKIEKIVEWEK